MAAYPIGNRAPGQEEEQTAANGAAPAPTVHTTKQEGVQSEEGKSLLHSEEG